MMQGHCVLRLGEAGATYLLASHVVLLAVLGRQETRLHDTPRLQLHHSSVRICAFIPKEPRYL